MRTSGTSTRPPTPSIDGAVTFCVLGPLEVWEGTSLLDVGGPQERALLALLLTAPSRVFSVPAIVAGLWGEDTPGGAEKTVQSYISRLRRALPDEVAATVLTRRPGYLIAVDPEQVDAGRFRFLVATGHRELAAGRTEAAATTLRGALALWRGEAHAEFGAPFAATERSALEELRLAALEDRISADLGIGAGLELVGELEALVAAYPLRERLWSQLMMALYRSGRQGDALRTYQRARSSLVDELGVEPGRELQAVEAAVLAHDVRLLGPGAALDGLARVMTVRGPTFVGRDNELGWLLDAYQRAAGGAVVRVLVTGPQGMGKTRLLTELARQVQAGGGAVTDQLAQAGPSRTGAPALLVLDDLQRLSAAELTGLSEAVLPVGPPLLVTGACVWEELSSEQAGVVASLFQDRLPLPRLLAPEVDALVRLYVPPEAVAEAVESADLADAGGVPLHVHAVASRYGEDLVAARIGTAAAQISGPRRRLAESRDQVAEGVAELQRLRSLRDAHADREAPRRVCPFKGLAFYDVDDAAYFAGRERLVARLLARVVDAPLLAVVGASGSGKSSAVRAGLVAAVGRGLLPGSERWRIVVTTPAGQLPDLPPADLSGPGTRTLLVVDQFEELFTAVPQHAQEPYAEWLTAAADRTDVTVVVAVRSDYYARVAVHRRLADLLAANTVLVGEMTAEELRQAVEVPAATADIQLDPGLAETIAGDVAGEPGGLPLMSTALLSLWERGGGRSLSLADYREMGGVRTAVARLAEAAYRQLTRAQQAHARRMLLRLAEVDDAGEPIRRRVALPELAPDGDTDARTALDALAARRLLTVSATQAEVAHEALLREWPRLRAWLDDDESGRRLRRHLVPAATAWQSTARDAAELYRGQRLTAALDWMHDHPDDLAELERDFLRASREAAEADFIRRRRSIRRLRGLAAGLAGVLVLALAAGLMAVDQRHKAARLSLEADVRALRANALGEDRWDRALLYAAQAYRIDGSTDSRAALLQTVQRSPEATAVLNADQRLLALAVSEDGSTLATLGSAGTAYVWDTGSGRRVSTVPGLPVFRVSSLDLSPDGRHLAVVGAPIPEDPRDWVFGQRLMVADLDQGPTATVRTLDGPPISAARFASDGRTVVTLGLDGLVRDVDVRTGAELRLLGVGVPASDTTVLDGPASRQYLAAADGQAPGPVTAWEVDSGRVVWSSQESDGTVASISPDGTALVLGHADGPVEHIDLGADGARRPVPSDLVAGLVDVDWSPDGSTFAGATAEGTVAIWDAETLEPRAVLRGHSGTVSQVVYSPDATTLYASGYDRSVLAWDLTGSRGIVHVVGQALPAGALGHVMAADGSLAVTWLEDRTVQLLAVPEGTSSELEVVPRGGPAGIFVDPFGRYAGFLAAEWPTADRATVQVVDVAGRALFPYTIDLTTGLGFDAAFTADGRSLLTVADRRVALWDVRTGRPVPGVAGYEGQRDVGFVTGDARGRTVALSEIGGVVEVADLATGRRLATLVPDPADGENLQVYPLIFSPDGRWLAGGSDSGRVVVWDTETWEVRSAWVAVQGGGVDSLAFTPDSGSLVSGGAGTASVWDVEQGAAGGATLDIDPLRSRASVSVGTRDGGRTVVTLTEGRGVMLWSVSPESLLEHACQVAGRNLTRQEWEDALPNLPYERTCPDR